MQRLVVGEPGLGDRCDDRGGDREVGLRSDAEMGDEGGCVVDEGEEDDAEV